MEKQIKEFLDKVSDYVTNEDGTFYAIPEYSDDRLAMEISNLDFWQPIENAPKDGTWILGLDYDGKFNSLPFVTKYDKHLNIWLDYRGWEVLPNFWMPLPNPPKNG